MGVIVGAGFLGILSLVVYFAYKESIVSVIRSYDHRFSTFLLVVVFVALFLVLPRHWLWQGLLMFLGVLVVMGLFALGAWWDERRRRRWPP